MAVVADRWLDSLTGPSLPGDSCHHPLAYLPQRDRRSGSHGSDITMGVAVSGGGFHQPLTDGDEVSTQSPTLSPSPTPFRRPSCNGHQPHKFRFAACSQEVCFRTEIAAAFMACGRVLPIKRGAGIDHPFLLDLCRHVAAGQWVHLFPEGKVRGAEETGTF